MKQIEKLLIEEFKKNNVNYDTKPMVDYVDDSFTDVLKSVIGVVKKLNYIPCCKSDSELLCEGLCPTDFTGKCFKCGKQVFVK
tara:strand:- start:599 stop:847 length:249 start_codon:yes stop_codon:yes gene_type:complete